MKNNLLISEIAEKYYEPLNKMLEDLASKCVGGTETTLTFPAGKVILKLK